MGRTKGEECIPIEEALRAMSVAHGFEIEDMGQVAAHVAANPTALTLIPKAIERVREEYPDATFKVAFSDVIDPFLVIMVYGLDLSGPKYLEFRELSMPIYIEADDLGTPIVTMPGY
jgi:hypothetical protein